MVNDSICERIVKNNAQGQELVNFIESELPNLEAAHFQQQQKKLVEDLQQKFRELKEEYSYWHNKVVSLEKSLGIQQFQVPSSNNPSSVDKSTSSTKSSDEVKKELPSTPDNPERKDAPTPQKPKKEATSTPKEKKEKAPKPDKQTPDDNKAVDVSRLDLRVGRILNAKKHPDAESLYVEEIDVGEEKPRTVVSGLVKFVPLEEMQNRLVVVLCNLKPAKMRGVTSEAMVMCASTPDKVEILVPPQNSSPGDRVIIDEYPGEPDSILPPKKKIFEQVAPDLKTDGECNATYKSALWKVKDKGVVKSVSLVNVQIK